MLAARATLALALSAALSVSACSGAPGEEAASSAAAFTGSPLRGLLANPGLVQQPMKGVFYFPGDWSPDVTPPLEFYGKYPTLGGNAWMYTLYPADSRHLGFSETAADRTFAVQQIAATGANVIVMSYWGPPSTDNWMFWAPMQDAPQAQEDLFTATIGTNVVVMPSIEDSDTTECSGGHSPRFRLAENFPQGANWSIDGTPVNPLLAWVVDLANRFIAHPTNPAWPSHFARMYDSNGTPRYVIQLKDVSSAQSGVNDATFVQGFVNLAAAVKALTGVDVGFVLDPGETMDVPGPDHCGQAQPRTTYIPNVFTTGALLAATPPVIAIEAYRSEITAAQPGTTGYPAMVAHKRQYFASWGTWLPIIGDVSAGYDGHIVFAGSYTYGHDDQWRNLESELRGGQMTGIVFTAWNGYTEGWTGMPTVEPGSDGTDPGAMNRWLTTTIFGEDPRYCNHVHFVNGRPTYYVYGLICSKYFAMDGQLGALGAPTSSEEPSVTAGSRRNTFQYGTILWKNAAQAYEVHGLIGRLYASMNYDGSWLGMPTSDEQAWSGCTNGRYNQFEHGKIVWCPWSPNAVAMP